MYGTVSCPWGSLLSLMEWTSYLKWFLGLEPLEMFGRLNTCPWDSLQSYMEWIVYLTFIAVKRPNYAFENICNGREIKCWVSQEMPVLSLWWHYCFWVGLKYGMLASLRSFERFGKFKIVCLWSFFKSRYKSLTRSYFLRMSHFPLRLWTWRGCGIYT